MCISQGVRAVVAAGAFGIVALISGAAPAWAQSLAVRSSAAYAETAAPGSAATAFGVNLAARSLVGAVGRDMHLPRALANVSVSVDGRLAELSYVSPKQINFILPEATAEGVAVVVVSRDGQEIARGAILVERLSPGLYSSDGSGAGPGLVLNSATFARGPFPTRTPEIPGCDKRTRLTLFASGIRFAGNPQRVPLSTNTQEISVDLANSTGTTVSAEVESAGPSESYPGVDEVRFIVPEALEGDLTVHLFAEGKPSNQVRVSVTPANVPAADCSSFGVAYVYNTVSDLLAGDLWDVTNPEAVFADLARTPGDWPIDGVGTTALEARNGEVIGAGVAGAPELVWSDPHFPPTVRLLTDQPIPFVGVAAGNPASVIVAQADPAQPIHSQVLALAREQGLAFASIQVSGRFSPVSYSVAHNLLKQGTPLTDPAVDKAPFQLFFTTEAPAEWEISGFYAAAANVQDLVSVRGAPVHLHGFQLDRSRAGHVGSAMVESAEIRLYPLAPPVVRDADLTLSDRNILDDRLNFNVLNAGNATVTRTTVQGRASDQVVFQLELFDLHRGEPRNISLPWPAGVSPEDLEIIVDPFNDVLESDETNNVYRAPASAAP